MLLLLWVPRCSQLCTIQLLAWPCMCVCGLYFTWQGSGTMLRLCLLFRNAPGSSAQHTPLALPTQGERRGKALTAGRSSRSWWAALALTPSTSCYWSNRDISSHMLNFRPNSSTQIPNVAGCSCSRTACHMPQSSYCSVREHRNHGLLPARTVLRSAKISWTSCSRFLVLVVALHPHWMPRRATSCFFFQS